VEFGCCSVVDPREPFIDYKWLDVGMLDYDPASKLYLVQKVNAQGRVIDGSGKTIVNGGIQEDGMRFMNIYTSASISTLFIT